LRFKTIYKFSIWHTVTDIISTRFIFGEIRIIAKNAKIRLPPKKKKLIYGMALYCVVIRNDLELMLPVFDKTECYNHCIITCLSLMSSDDKKNQETGEGWSCLEAQMGDCQQSFTGYGRGGECRYTQVGRLPTKLYWIWQRR
jgi:hypothetical protein